jgi:glycosidase
MRFLKSILRTALLLLSTLGLAQAPHVSKIEPPNWWIGLPDPMLMLTGEHLDDAKVTVATQGVKVQNILPGNRGHYLFVFLKIDPEMPPGNIDLTITTPQGSIHATLPLAKRNPAGLAKESFAPESNQGFQGFTPRDVIYLIMPDRFADGDTANNFPNSGTYDRANPHAYHGGDLKGIQQHLPYLKDLGITTLWITPVYNNNDHTGRDYHGYGATDLYAVEEHFGTVNDYRSLVSAAHALGLKVLLDVVPNHIGPTHPWVNDPPSNRWLHGSKQKHLIASDQFRYLADPHSSPRDSRAVLEGWFADALPDMGTDDALTSQYLRQNALWWAETGSLDGFRIDTFPYVDRAFWQDFHLALHATYPRFKTVGEISGFDPLVTSFFVGGRTHDGIDTGLDTAFDFTLFNAMRKVILHDEPATLIDEVLQRDWLFPHPEMLVTYLGNHDVPRFMGEPGASVQKLKMAFSLLLTVRGLPQIYSGDEIGMPGGGDPDNRRDFPGGFLEAKQMEDKQMEAKHNAFTPSGRTSDEQQVFAHVQALLHLREQYPALQRGKQFHIFSDRQTMVYLRELPSEDTAAANAAAGANADRFVMVMNNADQERTVTFPVDDTRLATASRLINVTDPADSVTVKQQMFAVKVAGRSINIYRAEHN